MFELQYVKINNFFKSRVFEVFLSGKVFFFFHRDAKVLILPKFLQSFRKICKQQHLQPCCEDSLLLDSTPFVYLLLCFHSQSYTCIYND